MLTQELVDKTERKGVLTIVDTELESIKGFFWNKSEDNKLLMLNSKLQEEERNGLINKYKSQHDNSKEFEVIS